MAKTAKNTQGLGNPLAVATVAQVATSKEGSELAKKGLVIVEKQQQIAQRTAIVVGVTLIAGLSMYFGFRYYKNWRREKYGRDNIDNPDVQAAAIFRKAFVKVEPSGVLAWFLPKINLWTNTNVLLDIARRTTSIKAVAEAYKKLFDGDLYNDIQGGLSSSELNEFYAIINGTTGNPTIAKKLAKGDKAFSSVKGDTLKVYGRVWNSSTKKWEANGKLYGNFNFNEEIGTVEARYDYSSNSTYYIVKKGTILIDYGLVWDKDIKDTNR